MHAIPAIFLLLASALLAWAIVNDNHEWAVFSAAHNCKIVGKQNGDLMNVINSNGSVGIAFTSDKTAYLCNDGITYWRDS